jgi:hypothetical protein
VHILEPLNPKSEIYEREREFENLCSTLEENGVAKAKELTEFEWWNRIIYLKKKADELNKKKQ